VAYRLDLRGSVRKYEKTPQGGMRVGAGLTRGDAVFEYTQANGTIVREFRPLDEVSRADSLETLRSAPVTLGHPPGKVTRANYRKYAVGQLEGLPRMDDTIVAGELVVQAEDALTAVESRQAREVSCGYECDIDPTPGETASGERYDAIQRNIRYNHVALVPRGRAGSAVCLRLDSNNDTVLENTSDLEESHLMDLAKLTQELADAKSALALATSRADAAEKLAADEKSRADKAEGEREVHKARAEAADATEKARADAEELAAVSAVATKLVKGFKADQKTVTQIKSEVIAAKFPALKLDATHIDGAFQAASAVPASDDAAAVRAAARSDAAPVSAERKDSRAEMIARNQSAWKPKT
jgi:hypothetical protein